MAAAGHGPNCIRHRLEERKVPCPAWWNRQRGYRRRQTRWETANPDEGMYIWDFSVLKTLLMNPAYTGAIASQKTNYRFKLGTISDKKPDEWIVVENCHEAIVDRATFDIVQRSMSSRRRPRNNGTFSLFSGLLRCGECGKSLTYRVSRPGKEPVPCYCCKTYNAYGNNHCTQHRVQEDILTEVVLRNIRAYAEAAAVGTDAILATLERAAHGQQDEQRESPIASIAKDEARLSVLDKMVSKLYEDRMNGSINEANFTMMMERTQQEQRMLADRIAEGRGLLNAETEQRDNIQQWMELISQYRAITELDADVLNRLLSKVVVHESIDADHVRHLSIEIHFNFKQMPGVETYQPQEQRPYLTRR